MHHQHLSDNYLPCCNLCLLSSGSMATANMQWCILPSHAWPSEAGGAGANSAAPGSGILPNSVAQACALLDHALHWRSISADYAALLVAPVTPSTAPRQHHWLKSPSAAAGGNSNPVTPCQTPQAHRQHFFFTVESPVVRSSNHAGPYNGGKVEVAWRVTREATSKPGPVCPPAPLRPRPPIMLCPAAEMGMGYFGTN